MNRTPEEAKKLVAGPLGRQMGMFPLRFCKPAFFGVPPSREHPVVVNNGTASLLDLRGDLLAVTCHHVIEGYRRKLDEDRHSSTRRSTSETRNLRDANCRSWQARIRDSNLSVTFPFRQRAA